MRQIIEGMMCKGSTYWLNICYWEKQTTQHARMHTHSAEFCETVLRKFVGEESPRIVSSVEGVVLPENVWFLDPTMCGLGGFWHIFHFNRINHVLMTHTYTCRYSHT